MDAKKYTFYDGTVINTKRKQIRTKKKERTEKKQEWQGSFHTLSKKYVLVIELYIKEACIELFYITSALPVALCIFTMTVKGTLMPIHIALYLWLLSV